MAHITLSIPDKVYADMKLHPEVKWSEIARQSIVGNLNRLNKTMTTADFLQTFDPAVREGIRRAETKDFDNLYKKMKEKEWKRSKYLTQA